jgi:hypothetical protein
MDKKETLPERLVKHPFVWGGVGMLIRYKDDLSPKGQFWKTVGAISLAIGVSHALMTQTHDTSGTSLRPLV